MRKPAATGPEVELLELVRYPGLQVEHGLMLLHLTYPGPPEPEILVGLLELFCGPLTALVYQQILLPDQTRNWTELASFDVSGYCLL